MEKKQSSVEWLEEKIKARLPDVYRHMKISSEFEQAKAMHKQEMVDFGNDLIAQNDTSYIGVPNLAEIYYNETYGKSEQ